MPQALFNFCFHPLASHRKEMVNSSDARIILVSSKIWFSLHGNHSKSFRAAIFFIPKRKGFFLRTHGSTNQGAALLFTSGCKGWQTMRSALAQKLSLAPATLATLTACLSGICSIGHSQASLLLILRGITTRGGPARPPHEDLGIVGIGLH